MSGTGPRRYVRLLLYAAAWLPFLGVFFFLFDTMPNTTPIIALRVAIVNVLPDAALGLVVLHLFIAQRGLAVGTPVGDVAPSVHEPLAVKADEGLAHRLGCLSGGRRLIGDALVQRR